MMYRGIIGLLDGEPEGEIQSNRGGTDIEAELVGTFDDGRLVSGKAVAGVERERERPVVGDGYITTEEETEIEKAYVEFLANFGDGWVTLDTGDGEFLWNFLGAKHHVKIERAEIDLNALAGEIREWDRIDVWQSQVAWGDPDDEESSGGVTIAYHSDAGWSDGDRMGQLGFDGTWGRTVRPRHRHRERISSAVQPRRRDGSEIPERSCVAALFDTRG